MYDQALALHAGADTGVMLAWVPLHAQRYGRTTRKGSGLGGRVQDECWNHFRDIRLQGCLAHKKPVADNGVMVAWAAIERLRLGYNLNSKPQTTNPKPPSPNP